MIAHDRLQYAPRYHPSSRGNNQTGNILKTGLPTQYSRTEVEEDFAESFMYYILVTKNTDEDALVWEWNGGAKKFALIHNIAIRIG